jgi:hypothetical protein
MFEINSFLWLDWLKLITVILLIKNGVPYSVQSQDTDWFEFLLRKGTYLFSKMSKQSLLPIHSAIKTEGKWIKWPGREANLHVVTGAETDVAIPPLTLYVFMDHTGRCSPLILNSKFKIANIRVNCIHAKQIIPEVNAGSGENYCVRRS